MAFRHLDQYHGFEYQAWLPSSFDRSKSRRWRQEGTWRAFRKRSPAKLALTSSSTCSTPPGGQLQRRYGGPETYIVTCAHCGRASSPVSSLLRLPPELRNHIYSYLFQSAKTYRSGFIMHRILMDDLSLNQTCKQLRSETAALFSTYQTLQVHLLDY